MNWTVRKWPQIIFFCSQPVHSWSLQVTASDLQIFLCPYYYIQKHIYTYEDTYLYFTFFFLIPQRTYQGGVGIRMPDQVLVS